MGEVGATISACRLAGSPAPFADAAGSTASSCETKRKNEDENKTLLCEQT